LSEVYEAAASTVQDEKPHLVDKMTKSAGFAVLYVCLCYYVMLLPMPA